jgi:hypothetical protein
MKETQFEEVENDDSLDSIEKLAKMAPPDDYDLSDPSLIKLESSLND